MRIRNLFFFVLTASFAALFAGCASPPKAAQYAIQGDADPVLNRDINGKSLSVVVRIYQLTDAQEFSKLTFDAVASGRPESDFLGQALLAKTDAVLIPGGRYESTEKLLEDTKYVGILAFFRKPDVFYWRQLADAEIARAEGLSFKVEDCFIMLRGEKFVALPGQASNPRPDCGAPPVSAASSR